MLSTLLNTAIVLSAAVVTLGVAISFRKLVRELRMGSADSLRRDERERVASHA